MNPCVYVDGESHWIRSEACWKKLHGDLAELEHIVPDSPRGGSFYPDNEQPFIRINRRGKFFWDTYYGYLVHEPIHPNLRIHGAVYFTDFSGNDPDLHSVRVAIRGNGFDPQVIRERGELAKRRGNRLATDGVLEKPKGVDIGLTVRLLEDAYRHIFDICYLFTSDVDYLPVIRAMQAVGRKVVVFGYKDGQGHNSELEYVPDQFIDLGEHMKKYQIKHL